MFVQYLSFSVSIVFFSFIVGMIVTAMIQSSTFYKEQLSNLNLIKSKTINTLLGVGIVKWIVKNTFFKFFNPKLKIEKRMNLADLTAMRAEMTKAEIGHLSAFMFVLLAIGYALFAQKYLFALILLFVNLWMNGCPALLQQQNKRRLDTLISRFTV